MEQIHTQLRLTQADESGYFSGYASIFELEDSHQDIVKPGAFQPAIDVLERAGRMPRMLWQHNHSAPIGLWTFMEEDARGLYVEGKILMELRQGREAYTLLKAKAIDGLSIGYSVIQAHKRPQGGRALTALQLHEVSIVTFASNPAACVMSVKKTPDSLLDFQDSRLYIGNEG